MNNKTNEQNNIRVIITQNDNVYTYHVSKNEFTCSNDFDKTYYQEIDNEYVRDYPSTLMFSHDRVLLENNYNKYINSEYFARRNIDQLNNAIERTCDIHTKNGVKWWLTGSAALYVRGIDIIPHDLDIMTYLSEMDKIEKCIRNYIIEPFHYVQNWVTKGFGVIDYDYRIDYAFEPEQYVDDNGICDFGPYAEQHLEEIIWHNRIILVPPVELHLLSNVNRNRTETVKKIKEYIKEQKT